jgi:hypothetical protein
MKLSDKNATPRLFVKVRVQDADAGAIIENDRMFFLSGEVNEDGEVEIRMGTNEAESFAKDLDWMVKEVWRKKNEAWE